MVVAYPVCQRTLAGTQCLEACLVSQGVLARLHHQSQTAVDVLLALLLQSPTQNLISACAPPNSELQL